MRPKQLNLLYLIGVVITGAVLGQLVVDSDHSFFLSIGASGLLALFFCFRWYLLDASERGFRRFLALDIAVVACAAIFVPYYLFRSRGTAAALRATALFLLAVVGLAALDLVVRYGIFLLQLSAPPQPQGLGHPMSPLATRPTEIAMARAIRVTKMKKARGYHSVLPER